MGLIAIYLIITLMLPLYSMLSKSVTTYLFDLNQFEFQVSTELGEFDSPPLSAQALNEQLAAVPANELNTSSDGRLPATSFFPDFNFRSPVKYRIRGTNADTAYLVGSTLTTGTDWTEVDSNTFRRIQLRPVASVGVGNFASYFSTPALMQSIRNSLLIAVLSTVITVALAFGFAYALNRSCVRFKNFFKLVAMVPILVPSLLPGIALVYLFGNQGMLKGLMFGSSIYGPIGIVIGSVFFYFSSRVFDYRNSAEYFRCKVL